MRRTLINSQHLFHTNLIYNIFTFYKSSIKTSLTSNNQNNADGETAKSGLNYVE